MWSAKITTGRVAAVTRAAMVTRVLVPLAAVLLLGACSESTGGSDGGDGGSGGGDGGSQRQTALEGLTPQRLCELLPNDSVEQALGVVVKKAEGDEAGRPPILSKTCRYSIDFELTDVEGASVPMVTTDVQQTLDKSVDEVLDRAFTDVTADNEPVRDYERVDGIGEGAGYGMDPLLDGSVKQTQLVVVFTVGEERFQLDIGVSPDAELDQLRPLATELASALDAELG